MVKSAGRPDYLFEVSFEVANKIGGIYTVLKSKSNYMSRHYGKGYCLVGPLNLDKSATEFQVREPSERTQKVFYSLEDEGIKCHYGKWLARGKPRTILIDFQEAMPRANELKEQLWKDYKVDSWNAGYDFDEPVVWSWSVGMLLDALQREYKSKMVGHFHEWLAGAGLLHIKKNNPRIGTVFTTHATVLGRAAAASGTLASDIKNPDKKAVEWGVQAKHLLEKATAKNANVFSTVSETTALEANQILGRKPEVLVINGLNLENFPTLEEFSINHVKYRDIIKDFLIPYFFPYHSVNVKDSLIFFISGRNEFHAKGLGMFMKSLGQLNRKMKKAKTKKDVFVFVWVPDAVRGVPVSLLQSLTLYQEMKNDVEAESEKIARKLLDTLIKLEMPKSDDLLDEDFLYEARKDIQSFSRKGPAPLSAFELDSNNYIIKVLRENGLENKPKDKVHVIFYPAYLGPADGLLNLSYYEAVMGCHLGVFPSFYDPWGYTPLETAGCGVPTVTTDLTGFGKFIKEHDGGKKGIFVLGREGKTEEESTTALSDLMFKFVKFSKNERIENKVEAKRLSRLAGWKKLSKNYFKAHQMAMKKSKCKGR